MVVWWMNYEAVMSSSIVSNDVFKRVHGHATPDDLAFYNPIQ
jgi:hypothetical protein